MTNANAETRYEVCGFRLENGGCRLTFPVWRCVGENKCTHYRLDAEKLCPSCGKRGASWTGYGEHGGFRYTCWRCEHVWTESLASRPGTPGVCLRCGKEFDSPVPEVTYPGGINEIACNEWCAECNKFAVSILFRWSSAYRIKRPLDPVRGGKYAST